MFRIPRWLLCAGLLLTLIPFTATMWVDLYTNHGAYPAIATWLLQHEEFIIPLGFFGLTIASVWALAVVLLRFKDNPLRFFFGLPAAASSAFFAVLAAIAANDLWQLNILPQEIIDDIGSKLLLSDLDFLLIVVMAIILLTAIFNVIFTGKLLAWNLMSWVTTSLQIILLPIGIIWLQPKLAALTQRRPVEEVQEHLLE